LKRAELQAEREGKAIVGDEAAPGKTSIVVRFVNPTADADLDGDDL
jgi:hypothetical protein